MEYTIKSDYLDAWGIMGDSLIEQSEMTPQSKAASLLGKLGGASRSDSKKLAAVENGKKGGRPKKAK
jgi:hypothetical protein